MAARKPLAQVSTRAKRFNSFNKAKSTDGSYLGLQVVQRKIRLKVLGVTCVFKVVETAARCYDLICRLTFANQLDGIEGVLNDLLDKTALSPASWCASTASRFGASVARLP